MALIALLFNVQQFSDSVTALLSIQPGCYIERVTLQVSGRSQRMDLTCRQKLWSPNNDAFAKNSQEQPLLSASRWQAVFCCLSIRKGDAS
jgi:hypothetical protein